MASRSTILFLAANPGGDTPRDLDQECAAIERELKLTPGRDDFELRSKWAVTVDDLMRHLLDLQPTIVHFSGHGHATELALVGDDGRPQLVAPAALKAMIRTTADTVRLVVLNACYSDAQADVLRDAVGCAIGMKGTISDDAARAFAIGFYRGLGHRRSVRNAYEQAEATLVAKGLSAHAEPRCLVRPGVDIDAPWSGEPAQASPSAVRRPPADPAPASAAASSAGRSDAPPAPVSARYDLFLAHPSASAPSARALYDLLQPDVRIFLDERSLPPGARWDQETPAAQRASRATVVLISSQADAAWYLGAEIVTAIALHRAAPSAHALVAVILEPGAAVPYGLSHVQAIDAATEDGLAGVAARLRLVTAALRGVAAPLPVVPEVTSTGAGGRDHLRLHDRLLRLTDVLFEQIVFCARIDRSLIAPANAPLATRALEVAQLAGGDPEVCRRIAAELDRRAPWTR